MNEHIAFLLTGDVKHTALMMVEARPDLFRSDFAAWLDANWHVYRRFEREVDAVWVRGRRHYSARTLVEVIRHETAVAEKQSRYKINNRFTADLSRLYGLCRPERANLFERRVMANAQRIA